MTDVAWLKKNSGGSTTPVGGKKPNELDLYDMSGNVWEWAQDFYGADYYKVSPGQNLLGPDEGSFRVIRGAGWNGAPGRRAHGPLQLEPARQSPEPHRLPAGLTHLGGTVDELEQQSRPSLDKIRRTTISA